MNDWIGEILTANLQIVALCITFPLSYLLEITPTQNHPKTLTSMNRRIALRHPGADPEDLPCIPSVDFQFG